jgi:hypothetical protein
MTAVQDTACIDDLLGPVARAKGVRCPCPKHQERESGEKDEGRRTKDARIPDHKMAAANDNTDRQA